MSQGGAQIALEPCPLRLLRGKRGSRAAVVEVDLQDLGTAGNRFTITIYSQRRRPLARDRLRFRCATPVALSEVITEAERLLSAEAEITIETNSYRMRAGKSVLIADVQPPEGKRKQ